MTVIETAIEGLVRIPLVVNADERGWVARVHDFGATSPGFVDRPLVQQTALRSRKGALRGFHFRSGDDEWKIVRVVAGEAFDAVIDLRAWAQGQPAPAFHTRLSGDLPELLVIPPGCAHAIQALSDQLDFTLTVTAPFDPNKDRGFAWDDPEFAVPWPIPEPLLSERDQTASPLNSIAPLGEKFGG